jgi:hypothetical protein
MSDRLDQVLREDAREALDDAGFAARVMRALPPALPRHSWLRPVLLLGATALGSLLAALFLPAGSIAVVQGFVDLAQHRVMTPAAMAALGMGLALAISSIVLAAETD